MKQPVSFNMFVDAFNDANRQDNFTYEGLTALFEHLESYESDTGEELELDVIDYCCNFNEETAKDIASNYDIEYDDNDEASLIEAVEEYLQDNASFCAETISGSFIYQIF